MNTDVTVVRLLTGAGRTAFSLVDALCTLLRHVHGMSLLFVQTIARAPLLFKNIEISIEQMYRIGIESLPLVSVTAIFLGAETLIQSQYQFSGFIPLKYLGMVVCKGTINELAPVITSLVVSGRIATAIAAEIGSMRGSEQLDAMECLALDPIRYLIVPKTVACVLMLPVLVVWAEVMAISGSIVMVIVKGDLSLYLYTNGLKMFFNTFDLFSGIFKTTLFGAVIAIVGSYFGFSARGGAEGVGEATTKAVMVSSVLILILDFIIAAIIW